MGVCADRPARPTRERERRGETDGWCGFFGRGIGAQGSRTKIRYAPSECAPEQKRAPTACQPHGRDKGDHATRARLSSCPSEGRLARRVSQHASLFFLERRTPQHLSSIRYRKRGKGTYPTSSSRGMTAHSAEVA